MRSPHAGVIVSLLLQVVYSCFPQTWVFFPKLAFLSLYSGMNKSLIFYIQRHFHAIHSTHLDSCLFVYNTVGDTISMWFKPGFSHEVGTDFLKRENGGVLYYTIFGKEVIDVYWFVTNEPISN